jgi:hypothetical protein
MKKIILIIVLFISNSLAAQLNLNGNAYYRLNCSMSLGSGYDGGPCGYGGLEWFYLQKRTRQIYLKNNDGSMWQSTSPVFNSSNFDNKFDESDLITSFRIRSNHRTSSLGSCYTESLLEHSIAVQKVNNVTYSDGQILAQYFSGSININTFPVVNLVNSNPANNIIGDDDYIDIPNITGIINQYYHWQYAANLIGPWIDLPIATSNNNSLHIKPNSFLPNSLIGSKFYLRVATGVSHATEQGTSIELIYRISAPHIIGNPELTSTSCFDSKDGTAKFTFDRFPIGCLNCKNSTLIPDEDLNYTLINTDTNTPVGVPTGAPTSINNLGNPIVTMQGDKTFLISELEPGRYTFKLFGYYNNAPTYTSGINHTRTFTIDKPSPVSFTTSKTDVWCNGGNDGTITINASGGTVVGTNTYQYTVDNGINWIPFTTGNSHTITGLFPATYKIKVRDAKACVAKVQTTANNVISLGIEKEILVTISQPATPVSLLYTLIEQPTFYGGSNGKIVAAITGGTILTNTTYYFEWKNSLGVLQTNTSTTFTGGTTFTITLNNVPSDTYTLTVKDKNFSVATQQGGCSVLNSSQFLGQPDPIVVTLNVQREISCNATNQFGNETDFYPTDGQRDESQDGSIVATVAGGVPFTGSANGGKPYKYFWKKQANNGSWVSITNPNLTLLYASHGNYALNVEDKNGIKLGTYINNVLTTEIDKTLFLQQPDRLELSFAKKDVSCGDATNGAVTAIVSGGKTPYRYEWTATTLNTDNITGLAAGNYFVRITDANNCVVQGTVNLPQPANVIITTSAINPSCHNGANGSIDLTISGGKPTFTYLWSNGATSEDLTNLPAGTYSVSITDGSGCQFTHQVVLINPNPITVNLGADRTLCNNQSHDIDITINDPTAEYFWTATNGFISNQPKVSLSEPGTYQAKVISAAGCVGQDDITIKTNTVDIKSEFFVTSQAYVDEEVMLVNTSNPFGENTEWIIPNDVTIVNQQQRFIVLKFNTTGTKTISLKQTQGDCYALYPKNINVEEKTVASIANTNNSPFIKDFIVTPNPSTGQFNAIVNLQEISPIKLRLYSYSGQTSIVQKSEVGQKNYVVDFNVNLAAGTYVLVLETAQQTLIRRIIIL